MASSDLDHMQSDLERLQAVTRKYSGNGDYPAVLEKNSLLNTPSLGSLFGLAKAAQCKQVRSGLEH